MSIHSCNHCNYTSDRLYNLKVHVRNMHGNNKNEMYNNSAPNIASIGNNVHPNSGNLPCNVNQVHLKCTIHQ